MLRASVTFVSLVSLVLLAAPQHARAQMSEAVGIRAQGMAGAFTAVADDATAAWWNPGGLAAGAYFNVILETSTQQQPAGDAAVPAWRTGARGFSIGYPAFALSYYRLRVSEIQPIIASTGGGAAGRQDQGSADVRLRSLVLSQFGATVGQSLGNHLVVASTLKVVRGSLASDVRPRSRASLDAAEDLDGAAETHAGLDLGALAKFGRARLGVMVRNLRKPDFGTGDQMVELDRHVRAGVSLMPSNLVTIAADFDVTKAETATGDERRFAAGAEGWTSKRRVGLRGGVSLNTVGEARPSASGGVSVAVRPGTFIDASGTLAADDARQGWGVALRVTF